MDKDEIEALNAEIVARLLSPEDRAWLIERGIFGLFFVTLKRVPEGVVSMTHTVNLLTKDVREVMMIVADSVERTAALHRRDLNG